MTGGLEFGCGNEPRKPEFDGVDIRPFPNVKYVCNAWEIANHVVGGSIPYVYSRHFFEHLTFYQAKLTLQAWHTILIPDGIVQVIVPNMRFHIEQWLNPNRNTKVHSNGMTDMEWAISGFWGKQREDGNMWDVHKSGYDFELLKDFLQDHGFGEIEQIHDLPKNLNVVAKKVS